MSDSSILDDLVVRPVRKEEIFGWNSYIQQYHYLGLKLIGGKSLRYIAHIKFQRVAPNQITKIPIKDTDV